MFSLIISIIAIALVVLLIAATMYNGGGDVLTEGKAQADAARLKSEESQIMAAFDMFNADRGRWPESLQELVDTGFLLSIPGNAQSPLASLIQPAFAAGEQALWGMPLPSRPMVVTAINVPQLTCAKYNLIAQSSDAIAPSAVEGVPSQCFGTEGNYRVVVHKVGQVSLTEWDGISTSPGTNPTNPEGPGTGEPQEPEEPEPEEQVSRAVLVSSSSADLSAWYFAGTERVSIQYRNDGNKAMTLSAALSSPLSVESNSCADVAPGATCAVVAALDSFAVRVGSGLQSLQPAGADEAPAAVDLNWRIRAAIASWSESTVNFGNVTLGQTAYHSLVLSNIGNEPGAWSSIAGVPAGFTLNLSACGSVAPGASCNVTVTFTPAAAGAVSSPALTLGDYPPNSVTLSGAGAAARYTSGQFSADTWLDGIQGCCMIDTVAVFNWSESDIQISRVTMNGTQVMGAYTWGHGSAIQAEGAPGMDWPGASTLIIYLANGQEIHAGNGSGFALRN